MTQSSNTGSSTGNLSKCIESTKFPKTRVSGGSTSVNLVLDERRQGQDLGYTFNTCPMTEGEGADDAGDDFKETNGTGGKGLAINRNQVKNKVNCYRTISLCTHCSTESLLKPDTFSEGQNRNNRGDKNVNKTTTKDNSNNTAFNTTRAVHKSRNATKAEISSNDVSSLARRKLISLNGANEDSLVKAANTKAADGKEDHNERKISKAKLTIRNGMRRSSSENKLGQKLSLPPPQAGTYKMKHQAKTSQLSSATSFSETSAEKFAPCSNSPGKVFHFSEPHQNRAFKMRKFNSVSDLPVICPDTSVSRGNQEEVFENSESIEANTRVMEWLSVVNGIEEYDTDPKDSVIEYDEEPMKTDTAIRIVYQGQ